VAPSLQYEVSTKKAEETSKKQEAEGQKTFDFLTNLAKESYDQFKSGSYGFFSLMTDEYAETEATRQKELRKKCSG
jgi:hypothetical protein